MNPELLLIQKQAQTGVSVPHRAAVGMEPHHYCCLKIPPERTGFAAVDVVDACTTATPLPSPTIVVPCPLTFAGAGGVTTGRGVGVGAGTFVFASSSCSRAAGATSIGSAARWSSTGPSSMTSTLREIAAFVEGTWLPNSRPYSPAGARRASL